MNSLVVKNIVKKHEERVLLNNLSINCKTGELISLFGRNGSGKSTLLQIIFGVTLPDKGKIYINEDLIPFRKLIQSKKIAYLPQDSFLSQNLKVSNIIKMYFKNGEQQDKIFYSQKINNIQNKKIGSLSLGELRYFELLLISNLDHPFLLLDEPFSMLEPLYIELIIEKLVLLKKEKGIILTDHYYDNALEVADKAYVLNEGNLFEIKDRDDLVIYNYLKR